MVRYSVRTSYVLFRFQGLPILRRQIKFEVFIWVRFDFGKDALGIANPVIALVVPKKQWPIRYVHASLRQDKEHT